MVKRSPLIFAVILIVCAIGCATPRDVKLYHIESGTVITGQIKNAKKTHGHIELINPNSGERFVGEYTSIPNDSNSLSYATSRWAKTYGFSFNKPRMIYGQAIIQGNAGTIIEIVYAVDRKTLHGYGVGRDNNGNQYKLHF